MSKKLTQKQKQKLEGKYYSHYTPIYEKIQDKETGEWKLIVTGQEPRHAIIQENKTTNDIKNFIAIENNQLIAKNGFDMAAAEETVKATGENDIVDLVGMAQTLSEDKDRSEQTRSKSTEIDNEIKKQQEELIKQKEIEENKKIEAAKIEAALKEQKEKT